MQPLKLRHIGKKEALGLISLMEECWDKLMLFDPSAYGLQGSIATDRDPQQLYGVKGVVPKAPAKKLMETNTVRSLHLGFTNEYELRSTENYLKANSVKETPLTIFPVGRRLYWTNVPYHNRTIVYKEIGRLCIS